MIWQWFSRVIWYVQAMIRHPWKLLDLIRCHVWSCKSKRCAFFISLIIKFCRCLTYQRGSAVVSGSVVCTCKGAIRGCCWRLLISIIFPLLLFFKNYRWQWWDNILIFLRHSLLHKSVSNKGRNMYSGLKKSFTIIEHRSVGLIQSIAPHVS